MRGLTYLSKMEGGMWLDLSRTRVTDVSVLFGDRSFVNQLSSLKLSGNRIAAYRNRSFEKVVRWGPLQDLDLSDTDADDGTLEALPDGLDQPHRTSTCAGPM